MPKKLPRPPNQTYCGTCLDCGDDVLVSAEHYGCFDYACQSCGNHLVMTEDERCAIHNDPIFVSGTRGATWLTCPYHLCSYRVGWLEENDDSNNKETIIMHDIKNVGCIAVYEPSDRTHARATLLVSDITDNKLVDRLEFPNLDFVNEDELEKAITQIEKVLNKHDAIPIPLDMLVPHHKCSSCKKLGDIGVYCTNVGEDEPEAVLLFACWHCRKWLQPSESTIANNWVPAHFASAIDGLASVFHQTRAIDEAFKALGLVGQTAFGSALNGWLKSLISMPASTEASKGINLTMGNVSRTEAGALIALTAVEMEKAVVNGGRGEGEIKTYTGEKVGEWSVNLSKKS